MIFYFYNPLIRIPILIILIGIMFGIKDQMTLGILGNYCIIFIILAILIHSINEIKGDEKIKNKLQNNSDLLFYDYEKAKKELFTNKGITLGIGGIFSAKVRANIEKMEQSSDLQESLHNEKNISKSNHIIKTAYEGVLENVILKHEDRKGHLMVQAQTRGGKGILASVILAQLAPLPNNPVLYIEPKNDNRIMNVMYTLAVEYNRPFYIISPYFENSGYWVNLLDGMQDASSMGKAIMSVTPNTASSIPWNKKALNLSEGVIEIMMACGMKITIPGVYDSLFMNTESLAEKLFKKCIIYLEKQSFSNSEINTFDLNKFKNDNQDYLLGIKNMPLQYLDDKLATGCDLLSSLLTQKGERSWGERTDVFKASLGSLCQYPLKTMISPSPGTKELKLKDAIIDNAMILFRLDIRKADSGTKAFCMILKEWMNYLSSQIENWRAVNEWPIPDSPLNKIVNIDDEMGTYVSDFTNNFLSMSASSGIQNIALVQSQSQIYSNTSNKDIGNSIINGYSHMILMRNEDPEVIKAWEKSWGQIVFTDKAVTQRIDSNEIDIPGYEHGGVSKSLSFTETRERVNLIREKDIKLMPITQGFAKIGDQLYFLHVPIIKFNEKDAIKELGLKFRQGYVADEDIVINNAQTENNNTTTPNIIKNTEEDIVINENSVAATNQTPPKYTRISEE